MSMTSALGRHQVLGLDTMLFIYYFEDAPPYARILQPLFEALERGTHRGVASTLTVLELLVKPLRERRTREAAEYRAALEGFPNLQLVPLDAAVAAEAAGLRARHALRTPDAVQVASALTGGATIFITNDRTLERVAGIEVLLLDTCVG